jgi:hypothetical protein
MKPKKLRSEEPIATLPTAISLGLIHAMVGDVEWKQGRPYYHQ